MTINQQCIAEIQKEFPKHTKQAYSLAQRTSETGVELCPRAKEIERSIRGKISPSKDMHRFQCSLRVRVSEEQHALVKQLIEQEGRFPTVQSWLEWWVGVWIKQKTAPGSSEQNTVLEKYHTNIIASKEGDSK